MARDDFNHRAFPRNAVRVFVFDLQDLQRRDWWRGEWKLDHLAFDKNWKLHFFAGPTCQPNGNEENAVAAARGLVSDGIHLVLARDEPVAPDYAESSTWVPGTAAERSQLGVAKGRNTARTARSLVGFL